MKQILRNSLWLLLENILSKLIFFFLAIYLVRVLGIEAYGQYSFISSLLFFFAILADFGLSQFLIREVARKNIDDKKISTIVSYSLLFVVFSFVAVIVFVSAIKLDPPLKKLVLFFAPYSIFYILVNNARNIFRGYSKTFFDFLINSVVNIMIVILVLFVFKGGLFHIFLSQNIALLCGLAIAAFCVNTFYLKKEKLKIKCLFDFGYFKYIFKETYPLLISILATAVYFKIDVVMIGFFKGVEQVAIYNTSYNFIFLVTSFMILFFESVYPKLAVGFKKEEKYFNSVIQPMLLVVAVLSTFLIIFGRVIIKIVFGNGFEDSALVLNILLASMPFWVFNKFFSYYLNVKHEQIVYSKAIFIGALVNVLLNLLLLRNFGYFGAAFATLIAELTIYIFLLIYIKKVKRELSNVILATFFGSAIFLIPLVSLPVYLVLISAFIPLSYLFARKSFKYLLKAAQ